MTDGAKKVRGGMHFRAKKRWLRWAILDCHSQKKSNHSSSSFLPHNNIIPIIIIIILHISKQPWDFCGKKRPQDNNITYKNGEVYLIMWIFACFFSNADHNIPSYPCYIFSSQQEKKKTEGQMKIVRGKPKSAHS